MNPISLAMQIRIFNAKTPRSAKVAKRKEWRGPGLAVSAPLCGFALKSKTFGRTV